MTDIGRGLGFKLRRATATTARVDVSSIGGSTTDWAPYLIGGFDLAWPVTAAAFADACRGWSIATDDTALRALRVAASGPGGGVYPIIRAHWDGDRYKVAVTVSGIGAAAGVVRVAEEHAAVAGADLVETDRTEGQRTSEGIVYGFVFEHGPGVVVTPIVHALEYCASRTHQDGEVEAREWIEAPVPGKRARAKVPLCSPCWAQVVVSGLKQGSYEIDID